MCRIAASAYACVIFLAATAVGSAPAEAGEAVSFRANYSAGTIVVKTGERRLYYVTGDGQALRYRVGVGKAGMQWAGTAQIDGKYIKPARPTAPHPRLVTMARCSAPFHQRAQDNQTLEGADE